MAQTAGHWVKQATRQSATKPVGMCSSLCGRIWQRNETRAGFTTRQVAEAFQQRTGSRTVTGMAGHWFESVQWALPTRGKLQLAAELFGASIPPAWVRRQTSGVSTTTSGVISALKPGQQKTDVWRFPTATPEERSEHSTPKPLGIMRFIVGYLGQAGDVVSSIRSVGQRNNTAGGKARGTAGSRRGTGRAVLRDRSRATTAGVLF
jgi:hypothetical protein